MVSYVKKFLWPHKQRRLPEHLQLRFLKQLYRLLTNGYPLIEALDIIKWDKQIHTTASDIKSYLKKGDLIDQAFAKTHFHQTITAYLFFVRSHGNLESSIEKCVVMFENRLQYVKKFQQVIRYPLILTIIFIGLLYVIKHWILPSFIDLYTTSPEASSTV